MLPGPLQISSFSDWFPCVQWLGGGGGPKESLAFLRHQCLPAVPAGLWCDLDVSYSGSFLMTLETKMNLIRLGKEDESSRMGDVGKDG